MSDRPRAACLLLATLLLAAGAPAEAGAEHADATLTLYLRDDGETRTLALHDGPDAGSGRGLGVGSPVPGLVPLGPEIAFHADAEVPEIVVPVDGPVAIAIHVRAPPRLDGDDPATLHEESAGFLSLHLSLVTADGSWIGGCLVEHVFTGGSDPVPLGCAFPAWNTVVTTGLVLRVRVEVMATAGFALDLDEDPPARVVLPGGSDDPLTAAIVLDGGVVEGVPAPMRAQIEGGRAPYQVDWSFGDGASGGSGDHVYARKGLYPVSLRVTDAAGESTTQHTLLRVHQRDHVEGARVVVAVIDTGVNPYHFAFHRAGILVPDGELRDAATGLPPRRLDLTFGRDQGASVAADDALWASIRPQELVRFEGTNLLGVSFHDPSVVGAGPAPRHLVRDVHGHGTATASTVVASAPDALIVAVQVAGLLGSDDIGPAYAWAAQQPWIDVISMSMGMHLNAPAVPTLAGVPAASREAWQAGKLLVSSAGNDPSPLPTDGADAPPWIVSVTGSQLQGESREVLASTFYPDVASDYTVLAASATNATRFYTTAGTSFSAPTVAGTLAAAVQLLREGAGWTGGIEDGLLVPPMGVDHALVRAALNKTALYHEWSGYVAGLVWNGDVAVLPVAPFAEVGWGHVDARLVPDLVAAVRARDVGLPPPPATKGLAAPYMAAAHASRVAYWSDAMVDLSSTLARPLPVPASPVEQDDAGTGADAPFSLAVDLFVEPMVVHHGTLLGLGVDAGDTYAVRLAPGDTVFAMTAGAFHCARLTDPASREVASGCSVGGIATRLEATAERAGVWHLSVSYLQPDRYAFSIGVNEEPYTPHLLAAVTSAVDLPQAS